MSTGSRQQLQLVCTCATAAVSVWSHHPPHRIPCTYTCSLVA